MGLGLDLDLDENYKLFYYLVYLLFMRLTVFFCIIYGSHYTILTNFYLYLQYFFQKIFSFSKITRFQIDPKYNRPQLSIASRKPIGVDMT